MIDFSAIESEIAALIGLGYTAKSVNCGRIRETVAVSETPAVDISATGHRSTHRANVSYEIDIQIVLRPYDQKRDDNANTFKIAVEQICAALEGNKGTSFDVLRNITSRLGEDSSGDGKTIRVAGITCVARKD